MSREQKCPVGSRWQPPGSDRVFVVTERKPFGQLVIKEEGRMYFGDTKQSSLLASFSRLPEADKAADALIQDGITDYCGQVCGGGNCGSGEVCMNGIDSQTHMPPAQQEEVSVAPAMA